MLFDSTVECWGFWTFQIAILNFGGFPRQITVGLTFERFDQMLFDSTIECWGVWTFQNCNLKCCAGTGDFQKSAAQWFAIAHWAEMRQAFTASHCNTLQHTTTHCNTLQHTATHCNTLQHTAAHCSTLQHAATHCNTVICYSTLSSELNVQTFATLSLLLVLQYEALRCARMACC